MSGTLNPAAATQDDYEAGLAANPLGTQPGTPPAPAPPPAPASMGALPLAQTDDDTPAAAPPAPPPAPAPSLRDAQAHAAKIAPLQSEARQAHAQDWAPISDQDLKRAPIQSIDTGPKADTKQGFWKDFGDRMWAGTLQGGTAALGVASYAANQLGSDPSTVGYIEDAKADLQAHIQKTYDGLSDAGKQALTASISDGSAFQHPARYVAGKIADFVPSMAAAVGAGAALAATLPADAAVAGSAGLAAAATRILPSALYGTLGKSIATSVGSAAVFGVLDAGDTYNTMVDKVGDATLEQIKQSPVGAQALAAGKSLDEAKKDIIQQSSTPFVALAAATGAGAGAGFGGMAVGGLIPKGLPLITRMLVGSGEAGATMGAQAGADDAIGQTYNQQIGTQKDYDPSQTALAVAGGFAAGAPFGAAAAVVHGGGAHAPRVAAPPDITQPPVASQALPTVGSTPTSAAAAHVDPAVASALDTALVQPAPTPAVMGSGSEPAASGAATAPPGGVPAPDPTPPSPGGAQEIASAAPPAKTLAPAAIPAPPPAPPAPAPGTAGPVDQPQAPAPPQIMPDLGTLGAAIGGNLRDMLWKRFQSGSTTEAGMPSRVLQAANANRANITDRASFDAFVNDWAKPKPKPAASAPPEQPVAPPEPAGQDASAVPPDAAPPPSDAAPASTEGGTPVAPAPEQASPVEQAAAQTEAPATPEEAKTGDYTHGRVEIAGLPVAIETPKGATRSGVGPDGKPWSVELPAHYGYLENTRGADGDEQDVYLGPKADQATPESPAFVIDQRDPKTGVFDEHKTMIGFDTKEEAQAAYEKAFSDGTGKARVGNITQLRVKDLPGWMGDRQEPLSYHPTKGDLLKFQVKQQAAEKRAATKARLEAAKGITVERDPNVHVAPPTTEDAPIRARPQVAPEPPRADVGAMFDDLTGHEHAEGAEETSPALAEDHVEPEQEEAAHEEPSQGEPATGGTEAIAALGDKTRSDLTTDRVRKAEDAVQAVLSGTKTIHEAANDFDWRGGTKPPRDNVKSIGNYLDHAIKLVDPDQVRSRIDELLSELTTENTRRTNELKGVKSRDDIERVNARSETRSRDLHEKLDEANKQLTRAADLTRLRDELAKTPDPIGDAVRVEKPGKPPLTSDQALAKLDRARARAQSTGTADKSRPYSAMVAEHLGKNIDLLTAMREAEAGGTNYKLSDALRLAARNAAKDRDAAYVRNLANHLAGRVDNIDVLTPEQAYNQVTRRGRFDNIDNRALFQPGKRDGSEPAYIALNTQPHPDPELNDNLLSIVHEAMHAGVRSFIDGPEQNTTARKAMVLVQNEFVRGAKAADYSTMSDKALMSRLEYATTNMNEFHTHMMMEPAIQKYAANIKPSAEFLQKMRALGYGYEPSKSLWQHFSDIVRRVLGIATPKNAEEATLFDHALRPMQDLTDEGLAYGKTLASYASPGTDAGRFEASMRSMNPTGQGMRDAAEKLGRLVDIGGVTDRARRAMLQAMTTDGIIKTYRSLFVHPDFGPVLDNYRKAQEAISRTIHDYFTSNDKRAREIIGRLQGREELAQLMNDATLGKVRLGTADPLANANSKGVIPPETKALEARFDAMSREDQQTYVKARDFYSDQHDTVSKAEHESLIKRFLPDATDAQRAEVDRVISSRSMKVIKAYMDDPNGSAVAKAFGDAWDRNKGFVDGIAEIARAGMIKGDYFPLRRYGDYVVTYGDDMSPGATGLDKHGVEFFEKKHEAETRRAELQAAGHSNISEVMDRRRSMNQMVSGEHPFVRRMLASLEDSSLTGEQKQEARDLLTSVVLEHGTQSDAARMARRRNIQGASTEAARVLAGEHVNVGHKLGYLTHGADRSDALAQMHLAAKKLTGPNSQIKASAVVHELELRAAAVGPTSSFMGVLARRATSLGFVQSVMSPSHMLTSSMEAQSVAVSLLSGRHGVTEAGAALARTMAQLAPRLVKEGFQASMKAARRGLSSADWDMARYGRDQLVKAGADRGQMERLFAGIDAAGLIDHTQDRDMRDIAAGKSYAGGGIQASIRSGSYGAALSQSWARFRDLNTVGAHAVDVMNRMTIAKAAFDLELAKTGSEAVAIQRATDTLRDAVPNYANGNKARIATEQGALGSLALPIMQFKNYGLHMYSVMGNLVHASLKDADPQARQEARRALAGIIATHALMAGSLGVIGDPLKLASTAYDLFTGASRPTDFEADVRGFLADTMGPTMGEIVSRGLPHALGIDVSHRVGLSNLLEVPSLESYDAKGFLKFLGTAMTGAAGDDAATMAGGMVKMTHGDLLGGFQALVPRVLRDPIKAFNESQQGVPGPHGQPGLAPSQIGPGAIIGQALGFQPAVVSEYREGRAAVQAAKMNMQDERTALVKQWVAADDEDRAAAMSRVQQFNADNPGSEILPAQLFGALRASRMQAATQGQSGARLTPMQMSGVARAGRFANVN